MDEEQEDTEEGTEEEQEGSKSKGGPGIVGIVLPALLAGAGAFGGAFFGGSPAPAAEETSAEESKVPGPTHPLNPFVINVQDKDGGAHATKITLAVELKQGTDPKMFEVFVPRVRDHCLTYLRSMTFEEISDSKSKVKMTEDLIALIHKLGAEMASQVLVQDFVVQ